MVELREYICLKKLIISFKNIFLIIIHIQYFPKIFENIVNLNVSYSILPITADAAKAIKTKTKINSKIKDSFMFDSPSLRGTADVDLKEI